MGCGASTAAASKIAKKKMQPCLSSGPSAGDGWPLESTGGETNPVSNADMRKAMAAAMNNQGSSRLSVSSDRGA
eukprot:CAMPEP_0180234066 /NCGR_PEP_ID=MMETSP0987-20121128/28442_1 /TAXON_ID=697907 /ORGANISM="non described non described, Strain CCMP2293" /LENGTH=73 /DNA_ID=CAMNT_0022199989 /DNA_START=341 /DNA_END=562 /DNA_ORIENTATION=+